MAIATSTAIAAGTAIAGAGLSFKRAADDKRLMNEAGEAMAKYMDDARKKFEVNFAEQLQVPLEGYRMAADLNNQAVTQALEAMRESGQRSIIGGVAGLQQQAQEGSEQLRLAMQSDLFARDKMVADEDSRLRDIQAEIDFAEATGAQEAAADSQARMVANIQSGIAGLTSAGTAIGEDLDLFKGSRGTKMANKFGENLTGDQRINLAKRFDGLSRDQMKFLEEQDPETFSPFLQNSFKMNLDQGAAVGGLKTSALGGRRMSGLPARKLPTFTDLRR